MEIIQYTFIRSSLPSGNEDTLY